MKKFSEMWVWPNPTISDPIQFGLAVTCLTFLGEAKKENIDGVMRAVSQASEIKSTGKLPDGFINLEDAAAYCDSLNLETLGLEESAKTFFLMGRVLNNPSAMLFELATSVLNLVYEIEEGKVN